MRWLEDRWYGRPGLARLLSPLEWLFRAAAARRRASFGRGRRAVWQAEVPVVVVGNLSVGGTGKTPLVIWLVEWARAQGLRAGVISRGYGGHAPQYPLAVSADTAASESGDEPLLIARRTGVPVVVDANRVRAARHLLASHRVDLLISDDGLQHYALGRQLEIVVIDGQRGLGNGHCLPVGPLREPPERLAAVDFRVVNGEGYTPDQLRYARMRLCPGTLLPVGSAPAVPPPVPGTRVHGVAGIGHPQRFFNTLEALGFTVDPHPFPDHQAFTAEQLRFADSAPIIMTEKDAVKCAGMALVNSWYLPVNAQLTEAFAAELRSRMASLCPQLRETTDG